jgi:uncharacterized membrane protein
MESEKPEIKAKQASKRDRTLPNSIIKVALTNAMLSVLKYVQNNFSLLQGQL